MKKRIIAILLLFIHQFTYADSPSFSYIELEYIAAGDIDVSHKNYSLSVDTDGYALTGSLELGMLILQASRIELTSDKVLNSELEDSISILGLGLAFELPQTSIYGLVRGRRDELELSGLLNEKEKGSTVGVEAGVRFNLTDRIELNGHVGRPSYDEGSSVGVGAQFFVTDNIGITLDYDSIDVEDDELDASIDTTSLGLRYSF